jgi:hypothetical protein
MTDLGRLLAVIGAVCLVVGLGLMLAGSLGLRIPFGRLPGDINVEREGWSFHFPLVTSLLLSVVLTLILALFRR